MTASVAIVGHRVTMTLIDRTTRRSFRKTLRTSLLDVSSAEWIVEAPSNCIGGSACQPEPLANFGSARFVHARAWSSTGRRGTIADPAWHFTKVELAPTGMIVDYRPVGPLLNQVKTSGLAARGSAFGVGFSS
jgi:hypothetical protein